MLYNIVLIRIKSGYILRLIDNAPSQMTSDLTSANVKVHLLSPRSTSMIYPMNDGVIAAFKRRYCRYHLQNGINCDERREGLTIYKVDQLISMRWSVAAWY